MNISKDIDYKFLKSIPLLTKQKTEKKKFIQNLKNIIINNRQGFVFIR